jgi:hypothetical protein
MTQRDCEAALRPEEDEYPAVLNGFLKLLAQEAAEHER